MKRYLKKYLPNFFISFYKSYKKRKFEKKIKGDRVYCPICKSTFKYFGNGGMDGRFNSRCHNCQSLERHRLVYLYLSEKFNFFKDKKNIKVLHFAPEHFFYKIFSNQNNIEYVPCDLFPDIYNYNGTVEIKKIDMTNIPYNKNTFDFIYHNQVLEHIPNDRLAMKELYRVMKKDGFGIFQVPIDYSREETYEDFSLTTPEERKIAFGQHDHVRWYGKDYKDRLEDVGFKVSMDDYVQNFSKINIKKYGLIPSELIYYCKK